MKIAMTALAAALTATLAGAALAAGPDKDTRTLQRGKYLVKIGACNDCHTAHYMEKDGKVPEAEWLTGSAMGFQGPWGTTYPVNLRLRMQTLSEEQWLKMARTAMRPPMPWFNLAAATDADLRAIYHYVRSLGPKGEPAPAYVAPGQPVNTPYIVFVPQNLPKQTAAATK